MKLIALWGALAAGAWAHKGLRAGDAGDAGTVLGVPVSAGVAAKARLRNSCRTARLGVEPGTGRSPDTESDAWNWGRRGTRAGELRPWRDGAMETPGAVAEPVAGVGERAVFIRLSSRSFEMLMLDKDRLIEILLIGKPPQDAKEAMTAGSQDTGAQGRARIMTKLFDFLEEPGAGEFPIALDGSDGDAECFRRFRLREAAEIAELHHLCGAGIQGGQTVQGKIEIQHAMIDHHTDFGRVLQGDFGLQSAALEGVAVLRVVHHNVPQLPRGNGQEVAAILPVDRFAGEEFQVKFVNQRGSLERVVRAFGLQ